MSLINTCRLNRVNPFACLLAIATHAADVQARPSAWLPWNYPPAEIPVALHRDPPATPGELVPSGTRRRVASPSAEPTSAAEIFSRPHACRSYTEDLQELLIMTRPILMR